MGNKRNSITVDFSEWQLTMVKTIAEAYDYSNTNVVRTLMSTDETLSSMYGKAVKYLKQQEDIKNGIFEDDAESVTDGIDKALEIQK